MSGNVRSATARILFTALALTSSPLFMAESCNMGSPPSDGGGGGGGGSGGGGGGGTEDEEPDLADLVNQSGLYTYPSWPEPGQPFQLYWYVCNYGGVAGSFINIFALDGVPQVQFETAELLPTYDWSDMLYQGVEFPGGLPRGSYAAEVYLDSTNTVQELNEGNNYSYYQFIIEDW